MLLSDLEVRLCAFTEATKNERLLAVRKEGTQINTWPVACIFGPKAKVNFEAVPARASEVIMG
jgi:hypothetical protein